uniref:Fork-head domain-containing protein n=1 Tax=Strigamia maritima TaxID=126957 RepID=T1JF42_STRMM
MCSNESSAASAASLLPYGQTPTYNPLASSAAAALDNYRLQLYNYACMDRFRYAHPALAAVASPYAAYGSHDGAAAAAFALSAAYAAKLDPRCAYRIPEEPKPQHSYIGLIGMAILSSADKKLVLSDIYQYILDNYPYFRSRGPGWRNSIRHNLSLNDCFIKAGRSANGKGHYWAIHPANVEDFKKGDFRRRKAQRRVRKHMGLSIPDDDDSPSSTPPPPQPVVSYPHPNVSSDAAPVSSTTVGKSRKRLFDVESLLAPDQPDQPTPTSDSECDDGQSSRVVDEASSSRKCSPDSTENGLVIARGGPCWPYLNANSEMSRWHEAVSRILIRTHQNDEGMATSKMIKLHQAGL